MVYLDYNASTPVDQRVMPAMLASIAEFGNPASTQHRAGQAASELIEEARSRVAGLVGRPPQDVIFTSGASEAAVIGLVGSMLGARRRPNVVVATTEHKAIIAAAELGARLTGGDVRLVGVDRSGVVDLAHLQEIVDDTVAVVAVMAANNETGVIAPTQLVCEVARTAGAMYFVDITQLAGKGTVADHERHADLMVCSSHKIYGPKGAGALIASRYVQKELAPIFSGGGQERGLRGGTHNTPAIVGFGLAAELAQKEQSADAARLGKLVRELHSRLVNQLDGVIVNGEGVQRLSNTLNIRFAGADGEAVMASMPNTFVSTGSACQAAVPTHSHVLLAMGLPNDEASESLRISVGRPTTYEEIEMAAAEIVAAVKRVRAITRTEGCDR